MRRSRGRGLAGALVLILSLTALFPVPSSLFAFERIAFVDSFDFVTTFDCETKAGTSQILDHVLLTGADTILWRHQTGGVVRFPTDEEPCVRLNGIVDKRRIPDTRVFGWARLEAGETNLLAYALAEAKARGIGAGIHYTFEENHHCAFTFGAWNLEHPQYWVRRIDGRPYPGRCSFAFDEVLEHKMRLLDELLASGAETIYLDCWRNGGWSPAQEYVEPVLAAWKAKYGCEPPKDALDPRWLGLIGTYQDRYLRAIRARLDRSPRPVRLLLGLSDQTLEDDVMWRRFAIDWKRLAADGTVDGIVVASVVPGSVPGPADVWEKTRQIYAYVMRNRGKAKVYLPVPEYGYMYGIPSYCRDAGVGKAEATRRLLELARDAGADGIVMECVDYGNYTPEMCELIRNFNPGR